MRKKHIEARLMYRSRDNVLARLDHVALVSLVHRLGLDVQDIARNEDQQMVLSTAQVRLLLAFSPAPFPLTQFRGVTRPPEGEAMRREILRRMAGHKASLSVVVLDRPGVDPISSARKQQLVWEAVDYILSTVQADLVLCPGLGRLMTGEEAESWLTDMGDRLAEVPVGGLDDRDGRRELFQHDPLLSAQVRAWLYEEDAAREEEEEILGAALRAFLDGTPEPGKQRLADTAAGRSALYVMSATIAVFALPLGAAALSYNALSGGSLRMTAYSMAATGLGTALGNGDLNAAVHTLSTLF